MAEEQDVREVGILFSLRDEFTSPLAAFETRLSDSVGRMTKKVNGLSAAFEDIPPLSSVVGEPAAAGVVSQIVEDLNLISESVGGFAGSQSGALSAVASLTRAVSEQISNIIGLGEAFKSASASAAELGQIDLSNVSPGTAASGALSTMSESIGSLAGLVSIVKDGRDAAGKLSAGLGALVSLGSKIGPGLVSGLKVAPSALFSLATGSRTATSDLVAMQGSLRTLAQGPLRSAAAGVGGFGRRVMGLGRSVGASTIPALQSLGPVVGSVGKSFARLGAIMRLNPLFTLVTVAGLAVGAAYLIYENWEPISDFFKGLFDDVMTVIRPAVDFITDLFLNFTPLGLVIQNWQPISDFFGDFVGDVMGRLSDGVSIAFDRIRDLFFQFHPIGILIDNWSGIAETIKGFGDDIINGLIAGITGGITRLGDAVSRISDGVITSIKDIFGISSPSALFQGFGTDLTDGLALGVEGGISTVAGKVKSLSAEVIGNAKATVDVLMPEGGAAAASGAGFGPQPAFAGLGPAPSVADLAAASGGGGRPAIYLNYHPTIPMTFSPELPGHAKGDFLGALQEQFSQFMDKREAEEARRIRTLLADID